MRSDRLDEAGRVAGMDDSLGTTADASFTPAGAVAVPVSNVGGLHAIPVSIEGAAPVLMHFDLGNGSPMLVYPNYWKPQAMLARRPASKTLSGGVGAGGPRARTIATVKTIAIGGRSVICARRPAVPRPAHRRSTVRAACCRGARGIPRRPPGHRGRCARASS